MEHLFLASKRAWKTIIYRIFDERESLKTQKNILILFTFYCIIVQFVKNWLACARGNEFLFIAFYCKKVEYDLWKIFFLWIHVWYIFFVSNSYQEIDVNDSVLIVVEIIRWSHAKQKSSFLLRVVTSWKFAFVSRHQ